MEDLKTLLIATTFLAIGGLGLYMYKSDELDLDLDLDFDDNVSDISSDVTSEASSQLEEEDIDDYNVKPKSRKNEGTKRNTKKNGGTRKKY
jgi:hypothetical protein